MAELKITLTEQDLARLPKNVSAALLQYLQLNLDTAPVQENAVSFEYPASQYLTPINSNHRHRKLKIVSVKEAYELSHMLFDRELPIFKKFFRNEVVDGTSSHCEKVKVFGEMCNWGTFGLLAFLCGLDGPRKLSAPVTISEMVLNMQGHGLSDHYSGKAATPLIKQLRRELNEFYHERDAFHLFATTSIGRQHTAELVFATGTREAFNEALTKIVNE